MYSVKTTLLAAGAITNKYYWSSNEDGKPTAIVANPTSGTGGSVSTSSVSKLSQQAVRPVTVIESPRAK